MTAVEFANGSSKFPQLHLSFYFSLKSSYVFCSGPTNCQAFEYNNITVSLLNHDYRYTVFNAFLINFSGTAVLVTFISRARLNLADPTRR